MDVLIATDMEGIAGIEDSGECLPSHPLDAMVMLEDLAEGEPGGARLVVIKEGQGPGQALKRRGRGSRRAGLGRHLAKLLPAGHDSHLRAAQRRLGSLPATPVMRSKERRWLAAARA